VGKLEAERDERPGGRPLLKKEPAIADEADRIE
jgi:hypothetical protein